MLYEVITARVVNIHTIKPIDRELLIACAKETGAISIEPSPIRAFSLRAPRRSLSAS